MNANVVGIPFVVVALWATTCRASDDSLSNSRLTWELTPSGYLEPLLQDGRAIAVYAGSFSDAMLVDATSNSDCFATAYVLLRAKHSRSSRMPVEKSATRVLAEHGDLRIEVRYDVTETGFSKVVTYPNVEDQVRRISSASRFWLSHQPNEALGRPRGREKSEAEYAAIPSTELPENIEVRIGQINLHKSVYVDPTLNKSMSLKWSASPTAVLKELQERADWLGRHVLLSQVLFPDSYRVRSTRTGYRVNVNGLHFELIRDGDQYPISYPSLEFDRARITEFWSIQAQSCEPTE